eukprot:1753493-Rhodomonas_salina.1
MPSGAARSEHGVRLRRHREQRPPGSSGLRSCCTIPTSEMPHHTVRSSSPPILTSRVMCFSSPLRFGLQKSVEFYGILGVQLAQAG